MFVGIIAAIRIACKNVVKVGKSRIQSLQLTTLQRHGADNTNLEGWVLSRSGTLHTDGWNRESI